MPELAHRYHETAIDRRQQRRLCGTKRDGSVQTRVACRERRQVRDVQHMICPDEIAIEITPLPPFWNQEGRQIAAYLKSFSILYAEGGDEGVKAEGRWQRNDETGVSAA